MNIPDPAAPYRSFWMHLYDVEFVLGRIDVGGIGTRYIEAGNPENPTILMLHGIAGSLENFVANIGPLAKDFHILAMDFVGSGLSDKPDHDLMIADYIGHVRDFLAAKGVTKTSLIGVSLGSWVSMAYAARYPEDVHKIIMIAPAGRFAPPPGEDAPAAAAIREKRVKAVENPTWESVKAIFDGLIFEEKNKLSDMIAVRLAIYQMPEMKRSMPRIMALLDADALRENVVAKEEWQSPKVPTLLIETPDSQDLSYRVSQTMKGVPNATVVPMPKTRHWPQFEDPGTFNDLAREFLKIDAS